MFGKVKKPKKIKRKILYQAYLEEARREGELAGIARNLQIDSDRIVVKKVSTMGKIVEVLLDLFYRVGRILFILTICLLLTIGVNAVINPEMREILFRYMPF